MKKAPGKEALEKESVIFSRIVEALKRAQVKTCRK